jgi:hypothetical protein
VLNLSPETTFTMHITGCKPGNGITCRSGTHGRSRPRPTRPRSRSSTPTCTARVKNSTTCPPTRTRCTTSRTIPRRPTFATVCANSWLTVVDNRVTPTPWSI